MILYGSHQLTELQATFMRQIATLKRDRLSTDPGIRLRHICDRFEYSKEHSCDHNCKRRMEEDAVRHCPVMTIFIQLRKKKILGVNKSPGMSVPHTVNDQPINLAEYGLDVLRLIASPDLTAKALSASDSGVGSPGEELYQISIKDAR